MHHHPLRAVALGMLALLGGCSLFEQAQDVFAGLTNQLVAQGIVLNVEPPGEIDLSGSGYAPGAAVTVFLADAASVTDLESAPISGAAVAIDTADGDVAVPSQGDGAYAAGPLDYAPSQTWTLRVGIGDDEATAQVSLPSAPTFEVPATHPVETALGVSVTGTYDGLLAVVVDQNGDVTWSNRPTGIRELYDFTHGQAPTSVLVPATAFPGEGAYAVGISGMRFTESADLSDMNTALSTVMAGSMRFEPTLVTP